MEFGTHDTAILLAVLGIAALLLVATTVLRVPYPILLVVGGLALGFLPGMPTFRLPPDLVLVAILPPLLYSAAFFTSLRDLRRNVRPIGLLAGGLVAATTVGVAAVAHEAVGLGWAPAFVLGAAVAPTDAIAATSIARRLGLPRRMLTVLEGESLVNDATALVLYRAAVVAVVSGSFSLLDAGWHFVVDVAGGIGIGLVAGEAVRQVRRRIDNPPVEITISLLTAYFAYLPAQLAGVSAVLAAVTVGIYLGWHTPELTTAQVRLQGDAAWEVLTFVLNALLFTLVGLQLQPILDGLQGHTAGELVLDGLLLAASVTVLRAVWVFPATYLPRFLLPRLRARDPYPPWQVPAALSWAGMRGAVTLAAALALPLRTRGGAPFPDRDLIVFLAFAVILGTLVVQGLSLPAVIRLLRLEDDGLEAAEEAKARIHAAEAALVRLEQLAVEDWVRGETVDRLRSVYARRRDRFRARFDGDEDGRLEERSRAYRRLVQELLDAEQAALVELRRRGGIGDDVMHRVQRDIDLEIARLEP